MKGQRRKASMILLILLLSVLVYAHTPFIALASTVEGGNPNTQSSAIGG